MQSFLQQVATDLYARTRENFSNCCLVFPTQRAMLYFNKYMGEIINTPLWAPKYYTINNYIAELSPIQKAHDLTLLFELFKLYNKHTQLNESFEKFYYWGELMLSDFDDADKYRVDTNLLFRNLAAIKSIDERFSYLSDEQIQVIQQFWNSFNPDKVSEEQKNFITIWNALGPIYDEFTTNLKNKGIGYEGLICRDVANRLDEGLIEFPNYYQTVFVGFNALNECEKTLLTKFSLSGNALFYWDYDEYYLNKPYHEASLFIADNLSRFPNALPPDYFRNFKKPKNITVVSVPSNMGQTKLAAKIAADYNNIENTAIILTDETLLLPLLHGIPPEVNALNITMGYPVKNSSVANLIEVLFRIIKNTRKTDTSNPNLYYKDVLMLASHPFINRINPDANDYLNKWIIEHNSVWLQITELPNQSLIKYVCEALVKQTNTAQLLKELLYRIFDSFQSQTSDSLQAIEYESLFIVYNALNKLNETIQEQSPDVNSIPPTLYFKLVRKIINGLSIPFQGEPLSGMQIMGFLESRTLDFENIVMLPMNEGIMPKTNLPPSFIPHNLRKGYGLPTLEFRDAMYSYYFYRIIQRASNVTLLFNSQPSNGKDEYSRYIAQLIYESGHNVTLTTQTFIIAPRAVQPIVIEKSTEVLQAMQKWHSISENNHYLSPTALSTYIECPLRFYFRHVEGIKEPDKPTEEIDAPILGKIIHGSLENIYSAYKGYSLEASQIHEIANNEILIQQSVLKAFSNDYLKGANLLSIDDLTGINAIVYNVVYKYIKQVLTIDANNTPIIIKEMEVATQTSWPLNLNNNIIQVKIGGVVDRIDQTTTNLRVVDYKTGKAQLEFGSVEQLFNPGTEKHKKEIFQLLVYCLLLKPQYPEIIPSIYKLRDVFSNNFNAFIKFDKHPLQNLELIETDFKTMLTNLLDQIFNPKIPFSQTSNEKNCKNCAYNGICQRN